MALDGFFASRHKHTSLLVSRCANAVVPLFKPSPMGDPEDHSQVSPVMSPSTHKAPQLVKRCGMPAMIVIVRTV